MFFILITRVWTQYSIIFHISHLEYNNTEFIFLEAKEKVTVYLSKDSQVKKLTEFALGELSSAIESLKKIFGKI